MRRILLALALVAATLSASAQKFPEVVATGTLVDLLCYARSMRAGTAVEGSACRETSGRDPIGLIDDERDGKLWTVAAPPIMMKPHFAKRVRVTGEQYSPTVVNPSKVEVEERGQWQEVPLVPQM